MGIEIHFDKNHTSENNVEKCQICNGVIFLENTRGVDTPIFSHRERTVCNHFFHMKCIRTNYDIYIYKSHAFEIHCQKCGYLEGFTKKYKEYYQSPYNSSNITTNPNLTMQHI